MGSTYIKLVRKTGASSLIPECYLVLSDVISRYKMLSRVISCYLQAEK